MSNISREARKPVEVVGAISRPSLDPSDWEEFRALGHAMLDDMVDYLRTVRPPGVEEAGG